MKKDLKCLPQIPRVLSTSIVHEIPLLLKEQTNMNLQYTGIVLILFYNNFLNKIDNITSFKLVSDMNQIYVVNCRKTRYVMAIMLNFVSFKFILIIYSVFMIYFCH